MPLFSPRWKYSRRIEYSGCDQEVYQQDLVIHRSAGRDYEETSCGLKIWHIYVGLQCRADYGDLRFTDHRGRELAYYLWPGFDAASARVCVRLEGADAAGTLAIHYGNPTATTTSDKAATFLFSEEFPAGALNTDRWTEDAVGSITDTRTGDGMNKITGGTVSGESYWMYNTSSTGNQHHAKVALPASYTIEWENTVSTPLSANQMGQGGVGLVSGTNKIVAHAGHDDGWGNSFAVRRKIIHETGSLVRYNGYTGSGYQTAKAASSETKIPYKIRVANNDVAVTIDNQLACTFTKTTAISKLAILAGTFGGYPFVTYFGISNLRVRAYSATPPSLLLTSHGLLRPPLGAYLTVTPPGEFIPTPQTISGLYRIRTHVLQEAPYQVCLPLPVESSFHIYLKSLHEAPYQLILKSEQVGPYDIPGGSNLQGIYSIVSPLALEYGVHIGEQVLRDCFYGARIVQKLNQMGTAELDLVYDYVDDAAQPLVRQGAEIRILYNDLVRFSGEIRKITKDDTSGVWHLVCESGACHLSDRSTEAIVEYEAIPSDAIVRALLPSSAWEGDIAPGPKINYKTEYADLLSHIINLSNITGHDWRVRQQEDYFQVTGVTATTITVAGSTWGTDRYADRYLLVVSGGGKWTSFRVATNTADQLVIYPGSDLLDAGLRVGDAFRIFRDFKLDMRERIGSPEPVITLRINDDLFWSERTQDIDRVKNRIIVTGTSSLTQDRTSSIAGCTLTTTVLESSESVLGQNIDTAQTTIYIVSPEGYPPSGVVSIDAERIAYASISGNKLSGCTRGYGGTSPAGHNIRSEVVLTSELRVASTAGFPDSGYIRIGMEQMGYTSLSPTSFKTLTRGTSGTEVYAHAIGILVRFDAYSPMAPETGTSIDLYGVREKIVPALGVTDQNTLDRLAQAQLLVLQDLQEWGTGTLAATSFNAEVNVGDEIAVMEADGTLTTNYRLVGVTHDQNSGLISIEYGAIEEYWLDDLSRLQSGVELANARGAVASLGTVISVSSNGEMALVYLDSGKSVWCRVK